MKREFNYGDACEYARRMENIVGTWEAEEDYERYVGLYFGNPEDDGEERYQLLAMTVNGTAMWLIDFEKSADVNEIKDLMTEVLNGELSPLENMEDAEKLEGIFKDVEGFIEFVMLDMDFVEFE